MPRQGREAVETIHQLKSKDLQKQIASQWNIEVEQLEETILDRVNSIMISKENMFGETTDCVIEDLLHFKNIDEIIISMFPIGENDIKVLNQLTSVESISFDFCGFSEESSVFLSMKAKELYLDHCTHFQFQLLGDSSMVKEMSIVNSQEEKDTISLENIEKLTNLESLSIHNYHIIHSEKLLSLPSTVNKIDLDGSTLDDDKVLESLGKNVEISINDAFFYD